MNMPTPDDLKVTDTWCCPVCKRYTKTKEI